MLRLLLFVLPLGLDTLGASISLGIKSARREAGGEERRRNIFPPWLCTALLFSLAETVMPLVGLAIGFGVSLLISTIMHFLAPLLLVGIGLWELLEELRERIQKRKKQRPISTEEDVLQRGVGGSTQRWGQQILLALSVSLDELAIGFSLGAITSGVSGRITISAITLCILIGLQGLLIALLGLMLGRLLRSRLSFVKDWTEYLSGVLLIALGIWLLLT